MTIYTLDDIQEAFNGSSIYVVIDDDTWEIPEDPTQIKIVANGYKGSTAHTRRVNDIVNESIIKLIQAGDVDTIKFPRKIKNNQEDPLWNTEGYEGLALKLMLTQ